MDRYEVEGMVRDALRALERTADEAQNGVYDCRKDLENVWRHVHDLTVANRELRHRVARLEDRVPGGRE